MGAVTPAKWAQNGKDVKKEDNDGEGVGTHEEENDDGEKETEKSCQSTCFLHDALFRKVNMYKKPKFELQKIMQLHGNGISGKATGYDTDDKVE
ncbi:40S ribosomal protein S3a [Sciurus carolinensis]|uniref:40S ribosomal protein S3a n=1 Tax=Sciurus carolinensis TaxID=30640 RepID=A0AA41TCD6_SCICA|nr:40S ribosomal protein S3a [Sciurus carolinensis]